MRVSRVCLAAVGLLLLPAVGAAGPIQLLYTSELVHDSGMRWTYIPGDSTDISFSPTSDRTWRGVLPIFSESGWEAFPPSTPSYPGPDDPRTVEVAHSFGLKVTLTDPASGQSGTMTLGGGELLHWYFRDWGPDTGGSEWRFGGNFYDMVADVEELTIGGYKYTVQTRNADGYANLVLDATAATPEPGTLALGGIGLLSAAGLRLRRRLQRG